MTKLFSAPNLDLTDASVIADINGIRNDLRTVLRAPRRWGVVFVERHRRVPSRGPTPSRVTRCRTRMPLPPSTTSPR